MADPNYISPEYVTNAFVKAFSNVPRFGHLSDLSLILSTDQSLRSNYILGTVFVGCLLAAIFLFWSILLVIFTCFGPSKVGFLSGFQMKRPMEKRETGQKYRMPAVIRSFFLCSCMVVMAMAVLSTFVFGFKDLRDASDRLLVSVQQFETVGVEGRDMTRGLIDLSVDSANLRDLMVDELRMDQFCASAGGGMDPNINILRNNLTQSLYERDDFGGDMFIATRMDIFDEVQSYGSEMESAVKAYGIKTWYLWFICASFTSIAFFMMVGTMCTSFWKPMESLTCFNTWFLLPILLVLLTLAWSLVSVMAVGVVMNADFCSGGSGTGSPDATVLEMVEQSSIKAQTPRLDEAIHYWVDGCDSSSTFSEKVLIQEYTSSMNTTVTLLGSLASAMDRAGLSNLSETCGGKDFTATRAYLDLMAQDYNELITNATVTEKLLSCENINSIYSDIVYDELCTEIPEASAWAVGMLLAISFFAMWMVTLRSAWLETIDNGEIVIPMNINVDNQDPEQPLEVSGSSSSGFSQSNYPHTQPQDNDNAALDNSDDDYEELIQTSDGNGNGSGNVGVAREDVTTPSSAGLSGESTLSPMTMTQSEIGLSNANAHKSQSQRAVAFKDQEPSRSELASATQSSGSGRGYDNVDVQPMDDLHEAAESTELHFEDDDTDNLEQAFDDMLGGSDDDGSYNSASYNEKNNYKTW